MSGTAIRRRRRYRPWLAAILGTLLVPVACTAWVYVARDPAQHVAALDALYLRADRFYRVAADPVDVVPVLKDAVRAAGYYLYPALGPSNGCGGLPGTCGCSLNFVTEDCPSNGPNGPITCWVEGYRRVDADPQHLEHIYGSVAPRGSTFDAGPGTSPRYSTDPNLALVTISASLDNPRHFWASPTPGLSGAD